MTYFGLVMREVTFISGSLVLAQNIIMCLKKKYIFDVCLREQDMATKRTITKTRIRKKLYNNKYLHKAEIEQTKVSVKGISYPYIRKVVKFLTQVK